jgi:8-oxo-dGTP diphosphatase
MESAHFIGKVTQKALIVKDGKILINRYLRQDTFDLPGGRFHVGEDPHTALKREVKEELGIDVEIGAPFSLR